MKNLELLQLYNTTTEASFSSCFYRDWKTLVDKGFLPKE